MSLREYQQAAIDATLKAWSEGNRSALVNMPTGCGKTVFFAKLIEARRPGRAMVLAHREELIFQARDKISRFTGLDAEIEMGSYHADGMFGSLPPVIVSTVQTQTAGGDGLGRMSKFLPEDFNTLIIDEAHHSTSATYRRCIDWYTSNPDLKVLGVTATPDRADEEALGQVFDVCSYDYEILDAINDGWLVPVEQQCVNVGGLDFSNVRTTAGDLNKGELAAILEEEENLHDIASPVVDITGDRRAIIFAATVQQAERLAEIINRYKAGSADWICGNNQKEDRRAKLRKFSEGETQYMVNVGVLTEGFDDSGVEVCVMARPTKSRSLYAQMAGRAIRPADEIAGKLGDMATAEERRQAIAESRKPKCLILDFVGNAGRHKLCTSADILGGKYTEEEVEIASRKAKESNAPVDIAEALEEARKEAEQRRIIEAANRARIKANVRFTLSSMSPFDVFQLEPVTGRGWDRVKKPSAKMIACLQRAGIKTDELSFAKAKQLLNEVFRRREMGLCTYKQQRVLTAHGIKAPLTFEQASTIIDGIMKRGKR